MHTKLDLHAFNALAEQDVRALSYGYGEGGQSVQVGPLHAQHLTDRNIVRKTLLVGMPCTAARAACELMRSSRSAGQRAKP